MLPAEITYEVKLIDDEVGDVEVETLLYDAVHQTIGFLNRAYGDVDSGAPLGLALRMQSDKLQVDVLCQTLQVLMLLCHDTYKRQDVHGSPFEAEDLPEHKKLCDDRFPT